MAIRRTNPKSPSGTSGRFVPGSTGGPGNPHARQVATLRARLIEAVTPQDMEQIARRLIDMAKDGDLGAIREVFDRTLGRPVEADVLERLDELERQAERIAAGGREEAA